ncbi:hypothetical protein ACH5RR_039568 [Cinchona calisaya]|uniref:Uncharacterized protein n=1 Tax=Cinchona calisaya TaxID=153742 RepID=A0ABD2Y2P6_9GENT
MFTGKRPTDDMFVDGLVLNDYARRAYAKHVRTIVDPSFFLKGDDDNGEVTAQVELNNDEERMECLVSILKIGVKCSAQLSNDRMPMNEIVRKLHLVKDHFLGAKINIPDFDI